MRGKAIHECFNPRCFLARSSSQVVSQSWGGCHHAVTKPRSSLYQQIVTHVQQPSSGQWVVLLESFSFNVPRALLRVGGSSVCVGREEQSDMCSTIPSNSLPHCRAPRRLGGSTFTCYCLPWKLCSWTLYRHRLKRNGV